MEWKVLFFIAWVIFFLLIDYRYLRYSILGGLAAVILQLIVDYAGSKLGLYQVFGDTILFNNSPLFYTMGVPITMGTVYMQYYPDKKWLKLLNIPVCALLFLFEEILLEKRGVLVYKNWNTFYSYIVNIFAFIILSWIREVFLPPWKGRMREKYV